MDTDEPQRVTKTARLIGLRNVRMMVSFIQVMVNKMSMYTIRNWIIGLGKTTTWNSLCSKRLMATRPKRKSGWSDIVQWTVVENCVQTRWWSSWFERCMAILKDLLEQLKDAGLSWMFDCPGIEVRKRKKKWTTVWR